MTKTRIGKIPNPVLPRQLFGHPNSTHATLAEGRTPRMRYALAMRYVVLGAGAVGGCIGYQLAEAGHNVLLIARGDHGAVISERGLTLREPTKEGTRPFACLPSAQEYEYLPGDLLILCVKSQDVSSALALVDPRVPVYCAQNGASAEQLAAHRFEEVYGMMVWLPALHLEPGLIQTYAEQPAGAFRIGRYPRGMDQRCELFARDLRSAGFDAQVVANIQRWKHGKLLLNLANSIDAFAIPDVGFHAIQRRAIGEAQACLQASGLECMSSHELREKMDEIVSCHGAKGAAPRPGGSTWQSVMRGKSTETEFINGWICELGDRVGVHTPANGALMRMAEKAQSPRSISIDEVRHWVLEEDLGR